MVMRNDTDPEPNEPGRRASVSSFVQLYPLPTDRPPAQWALGRHEVQIGRDVAPQRGIRIDSPRVSSLHATVIKTGSGYVLRDCESTNGTFVNLHKIDSHRLCPGDVIRIAGTLFLYREEVPMTYPKHPEIEQIIWGNSAPIRALRHQIAQLAQSSDSVLILGETGTGKELVAQALHKMSKRTGALVAINCAAITTDLAESILFGHLRGAFTGATRDQSGCFRDAERGTLFLDEFGELSPDLQAKVLRVLETKHIRRIGASSEEKIDVRVVAATNRNLAAEIDKQQFRADLYARFPYTLQLPPLRERKEDILPLFAKFLVQPVDAIPVRKAYALLVHSFPLNVRELRNAAKKASLFGIGDDGEDISMWVETPRSSASLPVSTGEGDGQMEAKKASKPNVNGALLRESLQREKGVQARVAKEFQRSVRQIKRLFEKFGLNPNDFKNGKKDEDPEDPEDPDDPDDT